MNYWMHVFFELLNACIFLACFIVFKCVYNILNIFSVFVILWLQLLSCCLHFKGFVWDFNGNPKLTLLLATFLYGFILIYILCVIVEAEEKGSSKCLADLSHFFPWNVLWIWFYLRLYRSLRPPFWPLNAPEIWFYCANISLWPRFALNWLDPSLSLGSWSLGVPCRVL